MQTRRYFGTDGIRGRVGVSPITPDFVLKLGVAVGKSLAREKPRATVLIGKDTRVSGYLLESALEAGFSAAGVDVILVGPLPTPGIAYLVQALEVDAGVVISASHNPYEDNGIKFFGANGAKCSDAWELQIEAALDEAIETVNPESIGKARRLNDAAERYVAFCQSTTAGQLDLSGLAIAVDAAHGACYQVLPQILRGLGATVHVMGDAPDGFNINRGCGATHPEAIAAWTRSVGATVGFAVDGDGDRLMAADASGRIFDGDDLLFAIAKDWHVTGRLQGGVVGTLMTNYALERLFLDLGIPFERAPVGDRYVLQSLQARGWLLGGENSGHLLCLNAHSTGDASIAALQVLAALRRHQTTLGDWVSELKRYPQVLLNVPKSTRGNVLERASVKAEVERIDAALRGRGRLLIRPSGTEPILRIMVECEDRAVAEAYAGALRSKIEAADLE